MDPIGNTGSSTTPSVLSTSGGSFSENSFLKILVSQMQNQTPLQPVDDNAFLQQMSAFSSMQEQRELNANMLELLNYQGLLARLQGLSEGSTLLGKEVTYEAEDGSSKTGMAEKLFVNEQGEVRIVVGGEEISIQQVTGIAATANA
jgi:flagellar basal-body rod modification protein FlgD